MKTTITLLLIALGVAILVGSMLWAPGEFHRLSLAYYAFLFTFIPMMTGVLVCRTAGIHVSEWSLLGVIGLVFWFWASLGAMIEGSPAKSIPIAMSNLIVTNLAAKHPALPSEHAEEFRLAVYQFFTDTYPKQRLSNWRIGVIAHSPIVLGFFLFMFFSYLGFTMSRRAIQREMVGRLEEKRAAAPVQDGWPPADSI